MKPKKLKLPCCETNNESEQNTVECVYCECHFESQELADLHVHEIHKEKVEIKRYFKCCRKQPRRRYNSHPCAHCECKFSSKSDRKCHTIGVHKCGGCHEILKTDYQRVQHRIKHAKEKELAKLQEEQRKELEKQHQQEDDNLVLNYVKKNKLDEYQLPPGHWPDVDYIICHHRFEKDELLAMVNKFKMDIFNEVWSLPVSDFLTTDDIIYLLENGAFSVEHIAEWMDGLAFNIFIDELLGGMVEYFLNKDYEIKREWVAALIYDSYNSIDRLIERIKEKYTFTFDEIYNARTHESFNLDAKKDAMEEFYVRVHQHFPDPDFEDPFADPYEDFKCVSTAHVRDHLHQRYFYDDEEDELFIVVGHGGNEREISLGPCKEMLKRSVQDLIEEYKKEVIVYDELNAEVSKGFDEMDEIDYEDELSGEQKAYRKEDIYHGLKDDIADRNHQANIVSKLYFVISMKPKDDAETEATVDVEQKEGNELRRMLLRPIPNPWIQRNDDKIEENVPAKQKKENENEVKEWSVTIRRRDGTVVPLDGLKSYLRRHKNHKSKLSKLWF